MDYFLLLAMLLDDNYYREVSPVDRVVYLHSIKVKRRNTDLMAANSLFNRGRHPDESKLKKKKLSRLWSEKFCARSGRRQSMYSSSEVQELDNRLPTLYSAYLQTILRYNATL
jgi:hypothetical protein